jgi:protein-tyrosine-phosphatase
MVGPEPRAVLFLCTGNAARSILAEAILNRLGAPAFRAYSAGAKPKGAVNPRALALLSRLGFETDGLHSKSWDAFAAPDAPRLDYVVTVCDDVAEQPCPVWPGGPMALHWSIPDPSQAASEAALDEALAETYRQLHARIMALCARPSADPDRTA